MCFFMYDMKNCPPVFAPAGSFFDNEIIDQGLLFMGMNSWVSPTYLVAGRMIRPS